MRRPIAAAMPAAILILLGFVALIRLPVGLLPPVAFPGLTLEVEYSGVNPGKMEELITKPLEEAIATVGAIKKIFSVTEQGKTRVNVEFDRGIDPDLKALEVRERADRVAAFFPREARHPIILRYDPDNRPIMIIALKHASLGAEELRELADRDTKKTIQSIDGVSEVQVAGGRIREIQVLCDRDKLMAYGLQLGDLLGTLQSNNLTMAAGRIRRDGAEFALSTHGRIRDPIAMRKLIVASSRSQGFVRIGDIASVDYAFREQESAARINGHEGISVYVYKAGDANLLEVSRNVGIALKRDEIPGLTYELVYDQGDTVRAVLRNTIIFGILGAGFAMIAIQFLFGSWIHTVTASSLVILAIPVTSLFLLAAGVSFHALSLTGLLISGGVGFGMSGLFLEDLKGLAANQTLGRAIVRNAQMLGLLSAAFIPLLFAEPQVRIQYGELAYAVLVSLASHAGLSACLWPLTMSLNPIQGAAALSIPSYITRAARRTKAVLYRHSRVLVRRPTRLLTAGLVLLVAVTTTFNLSRREVVSPLQNNQVLAHVELPSGASFENVDRISKEAEAKLKMLPFVEKVTSRVESGQSSLVLTLESGYEADEVMLKRLREQIERIGEAYVHYSTEQDSSSLREITVDVLGDDLQQLDRLTRDMARRSEGIRGITNVLLRYKGPRPETAIVFDRIKAEEAGLTAADFGQVVRYGIQGAVATKLLESNREIDVRVRLAEQFRMKIEDLNELRIKNREGQLVPLIEIAKIEKGSAPAKIYRKSKKRVLSFSVRVSGDLETTLARLEAMRSVPLPENYHIEMGESVSEFIHGQNRFRWMLAGALLLFLMMLAAMSESFRQPLYIGSLLPAPILVALVFLILWRLAISVGVFVGLVILASLFAVVLLSCVPSDRQSRMRLVTGATTRLAIVAGAFMVPLSFAFGVGAETIRGLAVTVLFGLLGITLSIPIGSILIASKSFPKLLADEMSNLVASLRRRLVE